MENAEGGAVHPLIRTVWEEGRPAKRALYCSAFAVNHIETAGGSSHGRVYRLDAPHYILYEETLMKYNKERLNDSAAARPGGKVYGVKESWEIAQRILERPCAPGGSGFSSPATYGAGHF